MIKKMLKRLVLVALLIYSFSAHAATYTTVTAFGDSISDPSFYSYNVWTEVMANQLDISLNNYALAGALSAGIQSQMSQYLANSGGVADGNALYSVLGGGNDALGGLSAQVAAQNLYDGIVNLYNAGARNFLLPTYYAVNGNIANLNSALDVMVADVSSLNDVSVFYLDGDSLFNDVLANPEGYGFPGCDLTCLLRSDGIHPTAIGQEIMGNAAYVAVIPIPAAAYLFASALIGLGALKRKRA